jgi:xanthine dehydrogenase molybdopterin-binding subunit B
MWTEDKEKQWKELMKEREQNQKEIGKLHTIKALEGMIESLKSGDNIPHEIDIQYLQHESPYAYDGNGSTYGQKITLIYKYKED